MISCFDDSVLYDTYSINLNKDIKLDSKYSSNFTIFDRRKSPGYLTDDESDGKVMNFLFLPFSIFVVFRYCMFFIK